MTNNFTREILKKNDIYNIIGLPPLLSNNENPEDNDLRKRLLLNTMMVLEITPGYPSAFEDNLDPSSLGLRLYDFNERKGREVYNKLVKQCVPNTKDVDTVLIAFLNENAFSESWGNEFGESFIEDALNMGIPTARELRLIFGKNSLSEAFDVLGKSLGGKPTEENSIINKIKNLGVTGINFLGDITEHAEKGIENVLGKSMTQVLYGSNMDFPLVWRGSSFSPSYSITVRLFNPFNLGNIETKLSEDTQEKYIIEPLVKLLALAVPISDSDSTFFSPLICKVNCPGLFKINMGYISSIDVIKGSDVNDVSYYQRPGIIDVKITFNDLYTSMVQSSDESISNYDPNRPTLKSYIDNLRGFTVPPYLYRPIDGETNEFPTENIENDPHYNEDLPASAEENAYGESNRVPDDIPDVPGGALQFDKKLEDSMEYMANKLENLNTNPILTIEEEIQLLLKIKQDFILTKEKINDSTRIPSEEKPEMLAKIDNDIDKINKMLEVLEDRAALTGRYYNLYNIYPDDDNISRKNSGMLPNSVSEMVDILTNNIINAENQITRLEAEIKKEQQKILSSTRTNVLDEEVTEKIEDLQKQISVQLNRITKWKERFANLLDKTVQGSYNDPQTNEYR